MTTSVSNQDTVLSNTAITVLTNSSPLNQITVTKMTVCNLDSVAHAVSVFRVPAGGSTSNATTMVYQYPVSGGATLSLVMGGHTLVNGQTFQAQTDTTNAVVNLSVSYQVVS